MKLDPRNEKFKKYAKYILITIVALNILMTVVIYTLAK